MWGLIRILFVGVVGILATSVGAHGQLLRMGSVGASSGIAQGSKHGMRSLIGQATAGIPVNDKFRHGVGFLFADTEIKIPNATEEVETPAEEVPDRFELRQNYPNPFNPSTTIEYATVQATQVRLEIFNILGQRVALLVDEVKPAGVHKAVWRATDDKGGAAASGVYIYRLVAGDFVQTRTMTLVK